MIIMRFTMYINESGLQDMDPKDIADILKKDCKPILTWMKRHNYTKFLQRYNRQRHGTRFDLLAPHKDREPRDMPMWVQKMLDDAFERKFGVRPRSSGVFCDLFTLIGSGLPANDSYFILFPVEKYRGIWAENIDDLYLKWISDIRDKYDNKELRSETEKWCAWVSNQYTDEDLAGVKFRQEIMLICDKYYIVNSTIIEAVLVELKKKK